MASRWLSLMMLTTMGSAALACNIPVFRYALERWRPDRCEVIVFYSKNSGVDSLSDWGNYLPSRIEGVARDSTVDPTRSLGAMSLIDINTADAEHRAIWDRLSESSPIALPYAMVRGDVGSVKQMELWHGPLDSLKSSYTFQSPARQGISRRLLAGDSVVWILLTGHDREKTESARKLIAKELPRLAEQIQLPEGIGLPGSELYSEVPLLVKFSSVEISYDDPKETFLVDLFSKIRADEFAKGEPLVIPVFGRGRALEVIPGDELNSQLMTDLTLFLSGACSCQVKEQNPGFDLLIDCDWNQELYPGGDEPPPASSIGQGARRRQPLKPELLDIPSGR